MSSSNERGASWRPPWFKTRAGIYRFFHPRLVLPNPRQIPATMLLHFGLGVLTIFFWAVEIFQTRRRPKRILWIGRYHLGDFLMSAPALWILRTNFPEAWIGVVLQQRYIHEMDLAALADVQMPDIDETAPFFSQVRQWIARYREYGVDCALFHRFTRPDLPALVAAVLARVPHRVGGTDKGVQALLTDLYTPSSREKVARYSLNLVVEWLGISESKAALQWPEIMPASSSSQDRWDVLIAPFAQHTKLWQPENWRTLLSVFRASSLRVAISAPPTLATATSELLGEHAAWVVNLAAKNSSLASLFQDVRDSRCLVSIDTGIRHVAATLGVPCVVIANEREHRDVIGGYIDTERFLVHDVPCAPCGAEPCPMGHLRCVREITVAQVLEALRALAPDLATEIKLARQTHE